MLLRLFTAAVAAVAATTASITSCGSTAARLQLTRLDLFPDPPTPGGEVFMAVEFENPDAPVAYGTAKRTVSLNGLPVVDEAVALCGDATTCPLTTGFNNRSVTSTWPDITGKVVSTIRWYDESAAELLCIKTSVTVSSVEHRLRGSLTHHLRGSLTHHLRGQPTTLGVPTVEPSKAIALLYPLPDFQNSTFCSIHQYHDLYE
jgi:hypothetical protein